MTMDQEGQQPSVHTAGTARPGYGGAASNVLKLKGLPYSTTKEQIFDFFGEYALLDVGFVYEPDGRASGLAFAEFESSEEATRALSKNGDYLGNRYIKLLRVPRREMEEQLEKGTAAIPGNQSRLSATNVAIHPWQLQAGRLMMPNQMWPLGLNAPPGLTSPAAQLPGLMPQLNLQQPLRPPLGQDRAMDLSRFVTDLRLALPGSMPFPPIGQLQVQNNMLPGMAALPGIPQLAPRGRPQAVRPLAGIANVGDLPGTADPTVGLKSIRLDGSTIKIRGLPFKATREEILAFFSGYQYDPDSLYIGQDPYGRPSGEAWLSFFTPEEARQAVRTRNREYLGKRYLELSVCQTPGAAGLAGLAADASPGLPQLPTMSGAALPTHGLSAENVAQQMPAHFLVDNQ